MCRKVIYLISFFLVLGMMGGVARPDLRIAEELLVDLRAEDLPYGEEVTTWPNHGSLGDFTANGTPVVEDIDGVKAVTFDGDSWFEGPTSTLGIEGTGTRTIEVWAYNPSIPGEETIVSWSHRGGPAGSNMAFNYGNSNLWGSMGHWSGDTHDMGWWGAHSPAPAINTWWHLVYTFDGTAARVYVNGEEESVRDPIDLDTHSGNIIRVAAQADDTGAGVAGQFNFTGSIAAVRIHDGVLSLADIRTNYRLGRLTAWGPAPADGAVHPDTWVSLSWSPGGFAVSHDVYLGENFADVDAGTPDTFRGNQADTFFVAGFPGFPYPEGLVPGTTYYWRIDEINDLHPDSPWPGNVWSFLVPPKKAYNPDPADSAKFIDPNVTLSWTAGFGAKMHTVYFGDDFDVVKNATGGIPQVPATHTPGPLELDKVYYWRVDDFDGSTTYTGDIWSFRTVPVIPVTDSNLVGWWKFDEGSGTIALDWSGQNNHGTLVGNPLWVDGFDGDALELDGADDYVALPIGSVISSLTSSTFTIWVDFSNAGGAWQRIFDFGTGTGINMFLTPRTGTTGPMRFAITTSGSGGENQATAASTLLSGWHHVAVTLSANSQRVYLDGVVVASNTGAALLTPSDLGKTSNNWLGRSQYTADAYFRGSLDDFRIYDYALTQAEIPETMRGDPLHAWNPSPPDESTPDVRIATPLSWSPGEKVAQHDVYFGTDENAVEDADTSDTSGIYRGRQSVTSYNPPEGVEWGGGPYYWRVDEYNTDGTISKGRVWTFTVADYLIVDDFESYNDLNPDEPGSKRIFLTWMDGYDTPTNGSQVGYTDPPFCEQSIVHSGKQSMPLFYNNSGPAYYSEATLPLSDTRDWTEEGVGVLTLWFYSDPANAAESMYVAVANATGPTAVVYHDNPNAVLIDDWTQWNIALEEISNQGVVLTNVDSIAIGFGNRNNPQVGGSGMVFIDDIRLYQPPPPATSGGN